MQICGVRDVLTTRETGPCPSELRPGQRLSSRCSLALMQPLRHLLLNGRQLLDAHGEPNEPLADTLTPLLRGADVAVRCGARMAARGRRVAQRRAERDAGGQAH